MTNSPGLLFNTYIGGFFMLTIGFGMTIVAMGNLMLSDFSNYVVFYS